MPDYKTDAGLLEHLRIQKLNIGQYKADVGADALDQQSIAEDHDNMKAIIDFCPLAEEYKTSATAIKLRLVRGNPGESLGTLMTAPVFTPPFDLAAGIEKRARERDGRFRRSKTITQAALDGLDLVDKTSDGLSPDNIKPTVEGLAAGTGYDAVLTVGNRGASKMWKAKGRRANSEVWFELASATGKSADIKLTPTTPGQPERIEIIIELYKNNKPYGHPSEPTYLTFNP